MGDPLSGLSVSWDDVSGSRSAAHNYKSFPLKMKYFGFPVMLQLDKGN